MLGIWYLFLWRILINIFEASANLIDWSLLTVTTIGEINYLSGQLVSFIMRFSAKIFLSSFLLYPVG